MTSKNDLDEIRERAALYALGALDANEARDFEERLAAGDARCIDELAAFRSVADHLAYAAVCEAPPPALRARVMERIAASEAPVIDRDGVRFVRSRQLGWKAGGLPGLEVKSLFSDATRGRSTSLVRMAPGTSYPAHRHADLEEIYLLEGDLLLGGVLMHTGDYCSAAAGTVHDRVESPGGCILIVTACDRDQLLD